MYLGMIVLLQGNLRGKSKELERDKAPIQFLKSTKEDLKKQKIPQTGGRKMKYNSVENAEQFIAEQIEWCKTNRYLDFTIWSNGKELYACTDTVTGKKPIEEAMRNGELKNKGFWKALIFRNGCRVEF